MPIPASVLAKLLSVTLDSASATDANPGQENLTRSAQRWGFVPGLFDGIDEKAVLIDLDKRCRQARVDTQTATFRCATISIEGRLLRGMSRERAIKLGYKLRLWAIFQITDDCIRVVYTGHNSRER